MRKLGILIAVCAAATLGFAGTASAQSASDFCDGVLGQVAEGAADSPIKHTTAGAQETCNESAAKQQLRPSPLLCGVEADIKASPLAAASAAVDGVHAGLADNIPENPIVGFEHPCATGGNGGGGTPTATKPGGGGGGTEVQAANAAPDGALPRTGGELFAGASFGLLSLGALLRRFAG